ncbi:MAG: putative L,D-transpeptidase ErfK/SrfK precursor [bacterium ADurb.Bin429]|nr:MAG: putative L,D-transpeptidase ErfK/SrfK precursor [bacterium ADurb.Bin429]
MRNVNTLALCVIVLASMMLSNAQTTLRERVARLPVSFGENTTIPWSSGRSWVNLGIQEHVGYRHLTRANPGGLSSDTLLLPGRRIAINHLSNGVVLNLPELMLYHWTKNRVTAHYPVSIGQITERWHTPVGRLQVNTKVVDPAWHRPSWAGGDVEPPGPNNPLGDRWIGLNRPGYGIHGTNNPRTIGRTVSHGCIRLFPPHIRELYTNVAIGDTVLITYETVAIGQADGVVYMAVFPDIYRRAANDVTRVQRRLHGFGLADVLTRQELTQAVRSADGIARPILGSHSAMKVNGTPVSGDIGPTLRGGRSYLPARQLAGYLHASVHWDAGVETVYLTRDSREVAVTNGKEAFIALNALFVPVRQVTEELGGSVMFSPGGIRLTTP